MDSIKLVDLEKAHKINKGIKKHTLHACASSVMILTGLLNYWVKVLLSLKKRTQTTTINFR